MDYSDYIRWKSTLSAYTGGICPDDCINNNGSGTSNLPAGTAYSDYLFYNPASSLWEIGSNTVHLGSGAGGISQGSNSIAIGVSANATGTNSIAIGKNATTYGNNSIVLNSTGASIYGADNDAFYVAPIRARAGHKVLYYDLSSKEITYGDVSGGGGVASGTIGTNDLYGDTYRFRDAPVGFNIKDGHSNGFEEDTVANAFAKIDSWFGKYLLSQPPAPAQLSLKTASTATNVYLAVANPQQIQTAFYQQKLPLMLRVNINLSGIGTIFNNNTQYVPGINEVNAVILSKVPVANPYATVNLTLSGDIVSTFKAYYYYNAAFITNTAPIPVEFWYSNYSDLSVNKLVTVLPSFSSSGSPGVPQNLVFIGGSTGLQSVSIDWSPPVYADTTNSILSTDPNAPALYYNLNYHASSTVRYGGVYDGATYYVNGIATSDKTLNYSSGDKIYPGTTYTTGVSAYSSTNSNAGPSVSSTFTTLYPSEPPLFSTKTLGFTTNYLYGAGAKDYYFNVADSAPVMKSYAVADSSTATGIAVHSTSNRGSTAAKLMNLSAKLTYQTTNTSIQTLYFNGFGASPQTDISGSTTDIEVKATNIHDYYSLSADYNKGFYLVTDAYVQLKPGPNVAATRWPYTIPITQTINGSQNTNTLTVRIDDISGLPTVNYGTYSTTGLATTPVGGIYILNNSVTLSLSSEVVNLVRYYYPAADLLKYNVYADTTYINSLELTSLIGVGLQEVINANNILPSTIHFNNNIGLTFNNIYAKTLTLKTKGKNLMSFSNEYQFGKYIVIDSESINVNNLIQSSNPLLSPLATTVGVGVIGVRRKSGESLAAILDISSTWYDYDNTKSLSTDYSIELPLVKGKFRTAANVAALGLGSFIEYNTYLNNGVNYSSLVNETGYRYASFAWEIPANSGGSYDNLRFIIDGIEDAPIKYNSNSSTISTANDMSFNFYYRFEQQHDTYGNDTRYPYNNINAQYLNYSSTSWINAQITAPPEFQTLYSLMEYNGINVNGEVDGRIGGVIINSTQAIYTVAYPTNYSSTGNIKVYAKIGIPMNANMSFKYIKCEFSTN